MLLTAISNSTKVILSGVGGIDVDGLSGSFVSQVIKILVIIGIGCALGAFITQGAGKSITMLVSIIIIVVLILLLDNAEAIGKAIKDLIYKGGAGSASGLILNSKLVWLPEMIRRGFIGV